MEGPHPNLPKCFEQNERKMEAAKVKRLKSVFKWKGILPRRLCELSVCDWVSYLIFQCKHLSG